MGEIIVVRPGTALWRREASPRARSSEIRRVHLSQVVSTYVGETEKNLRRLFDAAEGPGAVLLFDEADALFGKRGAVAESGPRYEKSCPHITSDELAVAVARLRRRRRP
ncbi:MAG: AAA family ATPase [Microbacterium sp.]